MNWKLLCALGVGAVTLVAGTAFIREQAVVAEEARRFPPAGRLVRVDGRLAHIHCSGPRGGGPVVVLESGMGGWSRFWPYQQPALAKTVRVCAYDRAGYGASQPARGPRDVKRLAAELHGALQAAGEPGPYVLVGASFGGHIVRMYHHLYPAEVAGLVMLDPIHEDATARLPASFAKSLLPSWRDRWNPLLTRFGMVRPAKREALSFFQPPLIPAVLADAVKPNQLRAEMAERDSWPLSDRQMRETGGFGDMPVLVISATEGPADLLAVSQPLHAALVRRSSRGVHRLPPNFSHAPFVYEPKAGAYVTDEILSLVQQAAAPAEGSPSGSQGTASGAASAAPPMAARRRGRE